MPHAPKNRKHNRIPLYVPVELTISELRSSGVTVNVGNAGASVRVAASRAASIHAVPGVKASLRLLFPTACLNVQARVVWRRQESDRKSEPKSLQVGFSFDLDDQSGSALRDVMQRFQYRLLILDWPVERDVSFLAESYELQFCDEGTLVSSCDDRTALILIGDSSADGTERLQSVLQATRLGPAPPILFATSAISPELEAMVADDARVFHQLLPVGSSQLRSVVRHLVDAQLLAKASGFPSDPGEDAGAHRILARQAYQRAVAIDPRASWPRRQLGFMAYYTGDFFLADQMLASIIDSYPADGEYR